MDGQVQLPAIRTVISSVETMRQVAAALREFRLHLNKQHSGHDRDQATDIAAIKNMPENVNYQPQCRTYNSSGSQSTPQRWSSQSGERERENPAVSYNISTKVIPHGQEDYSSHSHEETSRHTPQ